MQVTLETKALRELFADQELLDRWGSLAAAVPGASYFQTPDWIGTWWEVIAERPQGVAALVWNHEELVGALALAKTREPVSGKLSYRPSVLTNAGTGIGVDHAGWLARDGAEEALRDWLADQNVLLRGVSVAIGESVGGRLLESYPCPAVQLDSVEHDMSSKLAKTLRNARRRLADEGVDFRWKGPGDVSLDDLEALYSLHAVRRTATGDVPIFDDPRRRAFHDRLLEKRSPAGGTAVMVATQDGKAVGVLYGFVWQDTFAYYQIGWDPSFHRLSLGSVLVMEAIEAAIATGLARFDFLRGADTYKYRFGAKDVFEGSFAVGRSPGLAVIEAASRLRRQRSSPETGES